MSVRPGGEVAAGLRLLGIGFEALVAALAVLPTPAVVAGGDGRLVWGNAAFDEASGSRAFESVGRPLVEVEQGSGRAQLPHSVAAGFRMEGGETRLLDLHAAPLPDTQGQAPHWLLVAAGSRPRSDALAGEVVLTRLMSVLSEHVYSCEMTDGGRIVELYTGPSAQRFLGRELAAHEDPEEAWAAAIHPDDRAAYAAVDAELVLGRAVELQYRMVRADGSLLWAWERMFPRRDAAGRLVIDGMVTDVTEHRRMMEELAETHARLARVVEAADEYFYTVEQDESGRLELLFSGPGRNRMLGRHSEHERSEQELHDAWLRAVHPDDRDRIFAAVESRGEAPGEFEYRLVGDDGQVRWVCDRWRARRDARGRLCLDGVVSDVTERRRLAEDMATARDSAERRSRTDELTGIANRRHFGELLREAVESPGAADRFPAVLLVDVDRFKQINDTHGHTVGDQVLIELAARLRRRLHPDDRLARWGGEELVVLVADVPDDVALLRIAESLRAAADERPFEAGGLRLAVTVSVGAARVQQHPASCEGLLHEADQALYAAKRGGRNRACLASSLEADPFAEPEAAGLARALALQATLREGMPPLHAEQVSDLAARVALRIGLSPAIVQRCRLAGLLHDVGKIALPDRILQTADALSPEEHAVMRMHAEMGEQMARHIAGLAEAAPGIRHHHERFDGSGYPDGLTALQIPIEARILSAADAYSSMTCQRPHSAPREREAAMRELRAQRGRHFDPQVVDALLDVLEDARRDARRRLGDVA